MRLARVGELDAHAGCVNRLAWSGGGARLASGSDDLTVVVHEFGGLPVGCGAAPPWRMTRRAVIDTGHRGNIFGVRFLPGSGDAQLVSGAMDGEVRWHVATAGGGWESRLVHTCGDRVKAVEVAPDSPHLFYAASEDGTVLRFDTRTIAPLAVSRTAGGGGSSPPGRAARARMSPFPSAAAPGSGSVHNASLLLSLRTRGGAGGGGGRRTAVSLLAPASSSAELKSLAVSPANPHWLAVGASDQYVRLYDMRMLPRLPRGGGGAVGEPAHPSAAAAHRNVLRLCPLHLAHATDSAGAAAARAPHATHVTHVEFSRDGRRLLGSYHADGVYVYDVAGAGADGAGAPAVRCGDGADVQWHRGGGGGGGGGGSGDDDFVVTGGNGGAHGGSGSSGDVSTAAMKAAAGVPPPAHSGGNAAGTATITELPPASVAAKDAGNAAFRGGSTSGAIRHYSLALAAAAAAATAQAPQRQTAPAAVVTASPEEAAGAPPAAGPAPHPVAALHANRALALLKRGLPGDAADAVADCVAALALAPGWWKAELRLARAVRACGHAATALELARAFLLRDAGSGGADLALGLEDARRMVAEIEAQLGDEGESRGGGGGSAGPTTEDDDEEAVEEEESKRPDDGGGGGSSGGAAGSRRDRWVRHPGGSDDGDDSDSEQDDEDNDGGGAVWEGAHRESPPPRSDADAVDDDGTDDGAPPLLRNPFPGYPAGSVTANDAAAAAADPQLLCTRHALRCAGALNVQTDIKEAAFWDAETGWDELRAALDGGRGLRARELGAADWRRPRDAANAAHRAPRGYVVAGSDGGRIFVWDAASGVLVATLQDDADVTNAVRPHPTLSLLAASGIERTVRLWAPVAPGDPAGEPALGVDARPLVETAPDALDATAEAGLKRGTRDGALQAALTQQALMAAAYAAGSASQPIDLAACRQQ